MTRKELLARHGVELHPAAATHVLQMIQRPTPSIDRMVQERQASADPFSIRDLELRRIGVFSEYEGGRLYCVPVSWAQMAALNRDRRAVPPCERFLNLTVCGFINTSDERYMLTKRAANVTSYPDVWHVSPGGYVDADLAVSSHSALPQLFRELEEEVNISATDIIEARQLCICRHPLPSPSFVDICYFLRTHYSSAEVLARADSAEDKHEGKHAAFSRDAVVQLLETERFVPGGAAAIITAFERGL